MERVAFLVESSGQRIGCLLNPESVVVRRTAGVRPRRSAGGLLTGGPLADDPLLYTGGGTTEIDLDLLFDVTVSGSATGEEPPRADPDAPADVRALTRPLQQLTETGPDSATPSAPPLVRLIWGKGWNVPGVIVAVAERFDFFTASGLPQRSWLRLRIRRVAEPKATAADAAPRPAFEPGADLPSFSPGSLLAHELPGAGPSDLGPPPSAQRIDEVAFLHFGAAEAWRLIASFNNVDDPGRLPAGATLMIPPRSAWGAA